jgi:type I restriction enzyme R subunit
MTAFTESDIEVLSLEELQKFGFSYVAGPSIAPDGDAVQPVLIHETGQGYDIPEKLGNYEEVILKQELEKAIDRLNPALPSVLRQEAFKTALSVYSPQVISANEEFHKMLTEGIPVTVNKDGQERGERVWLMDFQYPDNNTFYAVNQFTITENNQNKRPDVILFINGLPLVVIELKNPADSQATIRKAYDQIQTYKTVIPALFFYYAFCQGIRFLHSGQPTADSSGRSHGQLGNTLDKCFFWRGDRAFVRESVVVFPERFLLTFLG